MSELSRNPWGTWRKSSASGGANGNCVEVASSVDRKVIGVRDTKDRQRKDTLVFDQPAWGAFLSDVSTGRFDLVR